MPADTPSTAIKFVDSPDEARELVWRMRRLNKRVGLVPTMGALHQGHLSLVREAIRTCDYTVVTIFVNPSQFAPSEDFSTYPRTLAADLEALSQLGADLVFAPSVATMYPEGFSTAITPPRVAEPLEGRHRPGHFQGVCTVVLKLFQMLPADVAFFGQKDYQQTCVIRDMVRDLNVPLEIAVLPTAREADGLALSSRNRYLDEEQRRRAVGLSAALRAAATAVEAGERDGAAIESTMRDALSQAGVTDVDYAVIVDPATLESQSEVRLPAMALIAAHVGGTRLIDNRRIECDDGLRRALMRNLT